MATVAQIQAQIAQIRDGGDVAPPQTWISNSSIKRKGKKYTYYRLMEADPNHRTKSGKPKGKMVQYLGSAENEKYLKMKAAVARRHQIEKLLKQLENLEQGTNIATQSKKRKPRQPTLTILLVELIAQVQTLQTEIQELKTQLSTTQK